jgi:hypothetical protein
MSLLKSIPVFFSHMRLQVEPLAGPTATGKRKAESSWQLKCDEKKPKQNPKPTKTKTNTERPTKTPHGQLPLPISV